MPPAVKSISVAIVAIVIAGGLLSALCAGEDQRESLVELPVSIAAGLSAVTMIFILRLELKITADAIEYRLFPLEWRTRTIRISEVETMEVGRDTLFFRHGGFGRRWKPWKKEVAYIMNRKTALYVTLKDGRRRVFSTRDEAGLRRYVQNTFPQFAGTGKQERNHDVL